MARKGPQGRSSFRDLQPGLTELPSLSTGGSTLRHRCLQNVVKAVRQRFRPCGSAERLLRQTDSRQPAAKSRAERSTTINNGYDIPQSCPIWTGSELRNHLFAVPSSKTTPDVEINGVNHCSS